MPIELRITGNANEVLADIKALAQAPMAVENLMAAARQRQLQVQQPNPAQQPQVEQPVETTDAERQVMQVAEEVPAGQEKAEPRRRRNARPQPTLEGVAAAQSEAAAEQPKGEGPGEQSPAGETKPVESGDPLDVPDFLKRDKPASEETKPAETTEQSVYEIPKTQEDARKMVGRVVEEKGAAACEDIIRKPAPDGMGVKKFSDIPVERYGELAALVHKALNKHV